MSEDRIVQTWGKIILMPRTKTKINFRSMRKGKKKTIKDLKPIGKIRK